MFIFYFLGPVLFIYIFPHSGRSFPCVRSPHATREADSAVLLIIFVTDLQQLLKIRSITAILPAADQDSNSRQSEQVVLKSHW